MMNKSNRLISILRTSSTDPHAKKMEDFRRNEKQIREAIADGWQLINIWNHLKGRNEFSGSYASFLRHVKKLQDQNAVPNIPVRKEKKSYTREDKRLSEELTEKTLVAQPSPPKRSQKTLALFLGKQDEIREAIDAGFRLKTIWKALLEMRALDARYNCFTWYVRKYLLEENIDSEILQKALIQENSGTKTNVRNAKRSSLEKNSNIFSEGSNKQHTEKKSSGFDHFHYDPTSIDKDSLI